MNELLGWYGYDRVDSQDTQHLDLQRFTSTDQAADSPPSRPASTSANDQGKELWESGSADSCSSTGNLTHRNRGEWKHRH